MACAPVVDSSGGRPNPWQASPTSDWIRWIAARSMAGASLGGRWIPVEGGWIHSGRAHGLLDLVEGGRIHGGRPPPSCWIRSRVAGSTAGAPPGGGSRGTRSPTVDLATTTASGDTWMGLVGLSTGFSFFCFVFDLSRRASNRLEKHPIYHHLLIEAVAMPAFVKVSIVVCLAPLDGFFPLEVALNRVIGSVCMPLNPA